MGVVTVTCKADTFLPFQQIQDFQGELKLRTQDDIDHLVSSIERHGFSFPFFVWRQPDGTCSCLDGHGRILALKQLESEGWEIPELPVVYIDAADEAEARTKLIQINVVSGKFTEVGFRDLVKDIPDLDLAEYTYPDLDLEKLDAEMKLLAQAQMSIQEPVDTSWDETFGDVSFDTTSFGENVNSAVSDDPDAPVPPMPTGTPGVVGTASTVIGGEIPVSPVSPDKVGLEDAEEAENGVKELVVYCPECGGSFLLKYDGEEG